MGRGPFLEGLQAFVAVSRSLRVGVVVGDVGGRSIAGGGCYEQQSEVVARFDAVGDERQQQGGKLARRSVDRGLNYAGRKLRPSWRR